MIYKNYSLVLILLFLAVSSSFAQYKEPEKEEKVDVFYPEVAFDSNFFNMNVIRCFT